MSSNMHLFMCKLLISALGLDVHFRVCQIEKRYPQLHYQMRAFKNKGSQSVSSLTFLADAACVRACNVARCYR